MRTYSLSGDPDGGRYRISVKRESHGLVSSHLHDQLRPGDRIEAAAPRGGFVLDDGTDAGAADLGGHRGDAGAGDAAPARGRAQPRARCGGSTRPTTRTATRFAAEAADLLGPAAVGRTLVYYTTPAEPLAPDSGVRAGRLTGEVIADLGLPVDATAYVCGPEAFMDDVVAALGRVGLDPGRIHTERFGSRSRDQPRRRRERTRRRRTSRRVRPAPARR